MLFPSMMRSLQNCEQTIPLVARLESGIRIEQYYKDHNPPHFHAIHQNDEALIEIAWPLDIYAGSLAPRLMKEVRAWALPRRARAELDRRAGTAADTEDIVIRLHAIQTVSAKPGYRLEITWANGTHSVVDLSRDISANGGIFAPLVDPATFESVRVGERARTIEWHVRDGAEDTLIDIDADALLAMAEPTIEQATV